MTEGLRDVSSLIEFCDLEFSIKHRYPLVTANNLTNDPPYLGNGTRWEVSYCYSLVGSRIWACHWY